MTLILFLGILFSIGAVLEESQGQHSQNNYISQRNCSRARSFLVLKWTVLGFLLTISYKSVLRAILMKTEYDEVIDTTYDMLQSDRQLMVAGDTGLKYLLESDPRAHLKALAKNVLYYNSGRKSPENIYKGYLLLLLAIMKAV